MAQVKLERAPLLSGAFAWGQKQSPLRATLARQREQRPPETTQVGNAGVRLQWNATTRSARKKFRPTRTLDLVLQ
jgi:hypothetical protein